MISLRCGGIFNDDYYKFSGKSQSESYQHLAKAVGYRTVAPFYYTIAQGLLF